MPFPFALPVSALPVAAIYALAYLVGLGAFALMAYRRGLATDGVRAVAVVGLLGGLVGANIGQWVAGGTGGKTVLGGIVGGYLCVYLYKRHIGLRRPLGDLCAVALCAGEAVGRWGCYAGGCCYGREVPAAHSGVLGAIYQHDAWRYPTQIYLSLACAAILLLLLALDRYRPLPENGLWYLQGLLYSVARFTIEFYRDGPPPLALGLNTAQWFCLVGVAFFSVRLWLMRNGRTPATAWSPRGKGSPGDVLP